MINYGYDMILFTTQSYKKHLNVKHNNKKTAEAVFHFAVEFFVIYKPLKPYGYTYCDTL